jgi:threonylcarbamoyladenosine tRNA methylthiotransferase MtaB
MSIEVVNFGCRLNSYEGEVIRKQAEAAGLSRAIIFNSCAVTAEAERQVRQSIRRARKEHPDAQIIVTGCGAQIAPDTYADMAEVDAVLGNEEKLKAESYKVLNAQSEDCASHPPAKQRLMTKSVDFVGDNQKILVNDIMSVKETASHMVASFEGRARAFVQIQNGCNHRCTFCIIPFGRGNSRSVPAGEVVNEIRALVEQGFNEVVVTGVDVSDYGKDLPGSPTLGSLLRRILTHVPELQRLRLSSIDAAEVDAETESLFASEPRLMPHLHLSVQAGDDMILKRMKRRHNRDDILRFTARMKQARPDIVFGADIIAGFPTETDAMFENTLRLVDEAQLTYLHIFPYSARKGTPAAKMPQVPLKIRKERASRLRAAGEAQVKRYMHSLIGSTQRLIVEQNNLGRTEGFAVAKLTENHPQGSIIHTKILGIEGNQLTCSA